MISMTESWYFVSFAAGEKMRSVRISFLSEISCHIFHKYKRKRKRQLELKLKNKIDGYLINDRINKKRIQND